MASKKKAKKGAKGGREGTLELVSGGTLAFTAAAGTRSYIKVGQRFHVSLDGSTFVEATQRDDATVEVNDSTMRTAALDGKRARLGG